MDKQLGDLWISVRVSRGQHDHLKRRAEEDDRPVSSVVRRLVDADMEREPARGQVAAG